ncbi:helix-turn-helix domain-containing protein [Streptomyces millisiae]|uniref:helix-turn-helix domain-containing protein n=1 Tax=Streptomyces millisiae TaxID=3075542 RepID=UPI00374E0DFF
MGLPEGTGMPRVRGLRREEVARLASISTDYYTRIEAGSAAVGTIAIQLVKQLGADVVIDYKRQAFESVLDGYDVVLDTGTAEGWNPASWGTGPCVPTWRPSSGTAGGWNDGQVQHRKYGMEGLRPFSGTARAWNAAHIPGLRIIVGGTSRSLDRLCGVFVGQQAPGSGNCLVRAL